MKALVTGGGGFLGRRIVELLIEEGHTVTFLARGSYPDVEALGARGLQIDLAAPGPDGGPPEALVEACDGVDVVIHTASMTGYWGDKNDFARVNVTGTQHVIDACRAAGVPRLIYTSTPSVIGYEHDAEGITEAPYPERWESPYGETKAMAELRVLQANGDDLATLSLRPHLIIGPRDNHLLPKVIERARQGRLPIVGDGRNTVDITYVDNAAWAHLDAMAALSGPDAACAGKAYFISNDEPVVLWDWVNDFLPRVGVAPLTRKVSLGAASALGGAMEWAWRTFGLSGEPRMTRFLAAALAKSHWYDMGPAKADFGYHVRIDMAEATERTAAWFRSLDGTAEAAPTSAEGPRDQA